MTRQIEASEVREGMEIEWKYGGYYTRCVVGLVQRENLSYPAYSIRAVGSSAGWRTFSEGEEVTVLAEPQPEEPTAFGACVEVAGVKYVLCDDDELKWKSSDGGGWWGWSDLCDKGHVTVVNADPFANPEPREPRVWDRWADVPEMTPVRVSGGETLYRKVGDRIEYRWGGSWEPAFADEYDLNKYSPLTEVLDA